MLLIAELAHHRDPEAIAEIIRQELQPFDIEGLIVEVAIVDSTLELQVRTNSAIDKEKLLTLVRSELQNLRIESVAKFRIHCWRNDEEMHEQRLLWTEQFMPEPLKSSLSQILELESDNSRSLETRSPEIRSEEPQLSKHSVLQQAIAQISPDSLKAPDHLLVAKSDDPRLIDNSTDSSIALKPERVQKSESAPELAIDNNYWQLLLVGLSIVLLGLGIGASVRAITIQNRTERISSVSPTNSSVENTPTKNITRQKNDSSLVNNKVASINNRSSISETLTPSPNVSESPISSSSGVLQEDETSITLEKFNRIQKGMTIEQVEKVFGASGKVIAENNSLDNVGRVYSWKNPQGSNAIIEFKDGQVVAKAQAGL